MTEMKLRRRQPIREYYILVLAVFCISTCLCVRGLSGEDTVALSDANTVVGLSSGDGYLSAFIGSRFMPGFEGQGIIYKHDWPLDRIGRPDWFLFGDAVWGMHILGLAIEEWKLSAICILILVRPPLNEAEMKVRTLFQKSDPA